MGVVPTLLMVATLGVTYGWQPDGRNGVEYIIQISPDELGEIERLGEISSTIDPAVRGRVSKVIVRVGTGPLPRTAPANLSRASITTESGVEQADHRPMAIPEIGDRSQATMAAYETSAGKSIVMKPQTGGGFSLPASGTVNPPPRVGPPAPSPTLSTQSQIDAAIGRANNAIDAAAAAGSDALSRAENSLRGTFPSTNSPTSRSTSGLQAPAFTGNELGSFASPRSNGPSTEPVSPRDRTWNNLAPQPTGIPSTNPVDPTASALPTNRNTTSPFLSTSAPGATGVAANDSFGRPPAGVTLPGVNQTSGFPPTVRNGTSTAQLQVPAAGTSTTANDNLRGTTATSNPTSWSGNPGTPRLTAAQLASLPPGTVTIDAFGRALNKDGQLLDPFGRPIPSGNGQPADGSRIAAAPTAPSNVGGDPRDNWSRFPTASQNPNAGVFPSAGQNPNAGFFPSAGQNPNALPYPNTGPSPIGGPYPTTGQRPIPSSPAGTPAGYPTSPGDVDFAGGPKRGPSNAGLEGTDRSTVALGRPPSSEIVGRNPGNLPAVSPPPASTPLINFLLLISFVVNIYLIAWFQKVRQRIRELVASKRAATPAKAAN